MKLVPTSPELDRRRAVLSQILQDIRDGRVIRLPDFDRHQAASEPPFALAALAQTDSPYMGLLGEYRYHFEGEEDLLHLFVTRLDSGPISVEDAQCVVDFLYEPVPKALIWLKPGHFSQHFYIGHDELLTYLAP